MSANVRVDRSRGRPQKPKRSGGKDRNANPGERRSGGGGPPPSSLLDNIGGPPMGGGRGGGRFQAPLPAGLALKLSGAPFNEQDLMAEIPRKKFTGRCRLFVGNLPLELKEEELRELFSPHGEISECFLSGKGFAFLRLDTRAHAESAKEALDGKMVKNRQIRVRYAVHGATIKLKELSPVVSNEMLHLTFSAFGELERAVHIVDEKGKPTGEGVIEFESKRAAQEALAQIRDRVFLLTANSRPLHAEFLDPKDEEDGLSEKMLQKTIQLMRERELGPRFAAMNSFEYVYGCRWKELFDFEAKRRKELDMELQENRRRLDADMEVAYEDYKAQLLREELQHRQEELDRLDSARRARDEHRQRMVGIGGGGGGPMPMMMESWVVDGPMGKPPPTFGRPPQGGGGGGTTPNNSNNTPLGDRVMGPLFAAIRGGRSSPRGESPLSRGGPSARGPQPPPVFPLVDGPLGRTPMQNGHNSGGGESGPDMRKLMQTFREPLGLSLGGGNRGAPPLMLNPLDRNPGGGGGSASPFSAFANLVNPLMGGGSAGGRIPPPPAPFGGGGGMGLLPPPPQNPMMMMMDFPPEKRSRHG